MKNFQQTPKQRRASLVRAKTAYKNSRNKAFQPGDILFGGKRRLGGVSERVLIEKQVAAGGYPDPCWHHSYYY